MDTFSQFNLTPLKKEVIDMDGHILVLGGPGSGKTTIALCKAKKIIQENKLKFAQKILFLSFARATVSRIIECAGNFLNKYDSKFIEITTYHSFIWNLLKCHGYLLQPKKDIKLLLPQDIHPYLIDKKSNEEKHRIKLNLFFEEGKLPFDLFAEIGTNLLKRSNTLLRIISDIYPIIFLDEFQDTDKFEWELISLLGINSTLIALADPNQRIYEFRGADHERLNHFKIKFSPQIYKFDNENYRSSGTDIIDFGYDFLAGSHVDKVYNNVKIIYYQSFFGKKNQFFLLKSKVINRINFLKKTEKDWSLAVLLPQKKYVLNFSEYLSSNEDGFSPIYHNLIFDGESHFLAGQFLASCLEFASNRILLKDYIFNALAEYITSYRGEKTSNNEINQANVIKNYLITNKINGKKRIMLVNDCENLINELYKLPLLGDPKKDWFNIQNLLTNYSSDLLLDIYKKSKYLRLLTTSSIYYDLCKIWSDTNTYTGAKKLMKNMIAKEHFSLSNYKWSGIHLMNIHKSKGKEFTETIIFENYKTNRFINDNATETQKQQSKNAMLVAITRSQNNTFIMTPRENISPFFHK